MRQAYRFSAHVATRVPLPRGRLAESLASRRAAEARWQAWAQEHRGGGPLVWVHGASVGESLTATPIVARLRSARPNVQIVHSFSSPSVADWPAPFPREHADYLPLDEPGPVGRVLDTVHPSLVVLTRGDLWPEFLWQADAREIPVAIVGASVRPTSLRLRFPVSRLYADALRSVSWIGTATTDDARRLERMGAEESRLEHTGDPRHDQVLERTVDLATLHALDEWAAQGPTLVAGSVEPSDESVLLGAGATVLDGRPEARLLIVPHRPESATVERIRAQAGQRGIQSTVWTPAVEGAPAARCVVVAARGLLNDLYTVGALAYVGGGFRRRKLHATIEPAALGLPVLVGPHWETSVDAAALVRARGAVPLGGSRSDVALAATWRRWIDDERERWETGLNARGSLAQGAASRTVARLLPLLD